MNNQSGSIRILIADDHVIFRDGLRRLLESEPGLEICGEASNGFETLSLVERLRPDLLLLDLAMPQLPGLEVLTRFSTQPERPVTIVLTAATDPPQILRALQLGAKGIVLKESATRVLFDSIRCVIGGGYWVAENAAKDLDQALAGAGVSIKQDQFAVGYGLTARESQIVGAILDGATNKEIASKLSITEQTVKNHLTNIFEKLGVSNRLELGLFAQSKRLGRTSRK